MFHIGIAVQHPPLPDPSQLSELGIDFIRQCLTIDPDKRPTAVELMSHPWIEQFKEDIGLLEDEESAASFTAGPGLGWENASNGGVKLEGTVEEEEDEEEERGDGTEVYEQVPKQDEENP